MSVKSMTIHYDTQYVKVDWNNPDHKHVIQQLKHRVVCNGSLVFEAIKWLRTRAQSHWSRRGNIFYFKSHEDALIFKIKFSGAVA